MTISAHAQLVQAELTLPLQSLYNLNWKNLSNRPNGKTYKAGNKKIDFWPTALDYTVDDKTMQVKWELDGDRLINVTFAHADEIEGLAKFLKQYLWGTE
jgi:hypothetical protein